MQRREKSNAIINMINITENNNPKTSSAPFC